MARRMSTTLKEYQFFRSFSAKIENWPLRKAEAIWRKMRERKIAGKSLKMFDVNLFGVSNLYIFENINKMQENSRKQAYRSVKW